MGRRFGSRSYSGPLGPLSYWNDYKYDMDHPEEVGFDGGSRFDYENVPLYSSLWRYHAARQRAIDEYDRTGIFDHYGDKYGGALDRLVNDFSGMARRGKRMAKNVEDIFDPEVEEDVSQSYRERESLNRQQMYIQDRWIEYRRRMKYNDW